MLNALQNYWGESISMTIIINSIEIIHNYYSLHSIRGNKIYSYQMAKYYRYP